MSFKFKPPTPSTFLRTMPKTFQFLLPYVQHYLLSHKVTAVTNWLEGEQGSELGKALEVNVKKFLRTVFIEGIAIN